MSDVPDFDTAGLPEELSAVDQLMHRGEANPRTRSGIMGVELLDVTPDWEQYRARFEQASRKAIRLRQKVVMPSLPTAAARWVVDPDFNLDFHVRRVRAPGAGTLREVFDFAELALQSPLDISRPLWTATLVEGLPGGGAANIVHMSHAVTDGVGSMEMFANLYDLERDPAPRPSAPLPIPEDLSPNDLARQGINALPKGIANNVLDATKERFPDMWVPGRSDLCFATTNAQLLSQAKRRHTVNKAEINCLGIASLISCHFIQRHAKHFGSGSAVHILTMTERIEQPCITRKMRHDAQLNLRIVGRHQAITGRRHKSAANFATGLGANRNVL